MPASTSRIPRSPGSWPSTATSLPARPRPGRAWQIAHHVEGGAGGTEQAQAVCLDDVLGTVGREVVLTGPVVADPALFGSAAPLVKSQALLRLQLKRDAPCGLLALGSREATRFHSGQGTELLAFLGRGLELCFRGWLDR